MPAAYKIPLKRERTQKPASVTFRKEILEHMKRTNYTNDYNRIQGELEGQTLYE
jgi:hypothetical protein